ncbi:Chitinase 4 [Orchesella cincta]|uniref:Chitinase 4 n=1 Tax=Orchesella cincta TaxID=48709 RepID=A0A1D2MBK6_ORCCI|nr:Chitinase 4 [Orchesella cincta]
MKFPAAIMLLLGVAVTFTWAKSGCWETGCQPSNWAVKGCGQYGMAEKGRKSCKAGAGAQGHKYNCCPGKSGGKGGGSKKKKTGGGASGGFVNYNQFRQAVTSNGYPVPSQEQYRNFNNYARQQGKISSKQESAMALAQILHESDGLRAKTEYACAQTQCPNEYRDARCDRPGQYYYGRGYIQLSWCYNYGPASKAIFGDDRLLRNPNQVATDDKIAWQTAFWFWGDRVHTQPGVQQGRFGASTEAINGGLECSRPGNAQAQKRFQIYGNVTRAFGLNGAGDSSGCA